MVNKEYYQEKALEQVRELTLGEKIDLVEGVNELAEDTVRTLKEAVAYAFADKEALELLGQFVDID